MDEFINKIKSHLLIGKCIENKNMYCYLVVSKVRYSKAYIEIPKSMTNISILCNTKEYINKLFNDKVLEIDRVVYDEIKDNINKWCKKGYIYKKSKEILKKETYDLSIIVKNIESILLTQLGKP